MANKGTRGWGDFRCDDVGERRKTKVDGEEELEKGQSASVNGSTSFDETSETNKFVNGKYMTWGGGTFLCLNLFPQSPFDTISLARIKDVKVSKPRLFFQGHDFPGCPIYFPKRNKPGNHGETC